MHPLVGHHVRRRQLSRAYALGRLPQSLLFTGPSGVGKQRLALWLGQLILCQAPRDGEPCGTCGPCRRVLGLGHPDLHWFMPVPRPKAAEADRQVTELEEAIAAVVAERRAAPLYEALGGMAGHFVATARLLQRRAVLTPVEGRKKVFILGEAERLVPQEANPEAANALLKLLEEPPADTVLCLTATDPGLVLPTIRSRTVTVRVGRLPDREVEEFLRGVLKPAPNADVLAARVRQAGGCIGAAIGADAADAKARQWAVDVLNAVLAGPTARAEQSLRQAPWSARGDFTGLLDALADSLHEATRTALGESPVASGPLEGLSRRPPAALLRATERVLEARAVAQGNVNPQLLLASLGDALARTL